MPYPTMSPDILTLGAAEAAPCCGLPCNMLVRPHTLSLTSDLSIAMREFRKCLGCDVVGIRPTFGDSRDLGRNVA